MKLRKIAALGLAAAMGLSIVACGGTTTSTTTAAAGDDTTAAAAGDETAAEETAAATGTTSGLDVISYVPNTEKTDETIVISLPSEPASLFGTIVGESDTYGCIIQTAFLDTLVKKDPNTGELVPALATEWEWLDDYRCEFTLRDDVKFVSDGHTLTADDVYYTFTNNAEVAATGDAGKYIDASKCEVIDDTHVVVGFNTAAPDLISMMSWTINGIYSEADVTAAGDCDTLADAPLCGTGRYKFVSWDQGTSVTFERNEDYWDTDYVGYYKTIKFTFASDGAAREMAIEAGDAQVTVDLDTAQAATYKANSTKVNTYLTSFGQVYHLWFNHNVDAMANADVRKAIDLALDYDALSAYATGGYGTQALGYISDSVSFHSDYYTTEERAQDIEQAKTLLAGAGYDNLTIKVVGTSDANGIYTIIQQQLAQVGITVEIDIKDTAAFVQAVAFKDTTDYDMILVGEYIQARTPDIFCFFRQANIDAFNIGGDKYTTPEIEAAIDAVIAASDDAEATEKVAALEALLKEDTLVLNICEQLKSTLTATNISGITFRERGMIDVTTFYAQ